MRSTLARTLATLGIAATLLLSGGCKSQVASTRTGSDIPTIHTTSSPQAAPPATSSHGPGTGGPGTVTISVTQPVAINGHAGGSVTCTTGRVYTAVAQSVAVEGYQVSFTVRVVGYRGAGSYPALVTLRLDGATGAVTTVSAVPNIPATITSSGGSFAVNATGDDGRTLAASLQWTCN
jgi:hypothetical protein